MSLYNMIHGVNPTAPALLYIAGFKPEIMSFPGIRFRDCYASPNGEEIILYTRIGGPNRNQYAPIIEMLRGRPNFLRDEDDSFDHTFASFYFSPIVEDAAVMLRQIHEAGKSGCERPSQARQLLDDLENNRDTPAVKEMIEKTKPIAQGLAAALGGNSDSVSVTNLEGAGVDIIRGGGSLVREEVPRASDEDA